MNNRQIAIIIARRKAKQAAAAKQDGQAKPQKIDPLLAACLDASGHSEHRIY